MDINEGNRRSIQECFDYLEITPKQAARYLGVTTRSIDRWKSNSEEIPGTVHAVLSAWCTLKEAGIPWSKEYLIDIYNNMCVLIREFEENAHVFAQGYGTYCKENDIIKIKDSLIERHNMLIMLLEDVIKRINNNGHTSYTQ